jgi:hypothetical protein
MPPDMKFAIDETRNQPPLRGEFIRVRARRFNLAHPVMNVGNRFGGCERITYRSVFDPFIKLSKTFTPVPSFADYARRG